MSRLRNAYTFAKNWFKTFLCSIHNVATESREGPDGVEYRVTFDTNLGHQATPWVSKEEAEAIVSRFSPSKIP